MKLNFEMTRYLMKPVDRPTHQLVHKSEISVDKQGCFFAHELWKLFINTQGEEISIRIVSK
jgi:hypothetical protein